MKNTKQGVSLSELLAVVVITGILAAISITIVSNVIESTRQKAIAAEEAVVEEAVYNFCTFENSDALICGEEDPYFLNEADSDDDDLGAFLMYISKDFVDYEVAEVEYDETSNFNYTCTLVNPNGVASYYSDDTMANTIDLHADNTYNILKTAAISKDMIDNQLQEDALNFTNFNLIVADDRTIKTTVTNLRIIGDTSADTYQTDRFLISGNTNRRFIINGLNINAGYSEYYIENAKINFKNKNLVIINNSNNVDTITFNIGYKGIIILDAQSMLALNNCGKEVLINKINGVSSTIRYYDGSNLLKLNNNTAGKNRARDLESTYPNITFNLNYVA